MAHSAMSRFDKPLDAAYSVLLKAMFRITPERIHDILSTTFRVVSRSQLACAAMRKVLVVEDPVLAQTVAGIRFDRPLGLAAGFDKNAREFGIWGPMGFGYSELGTLTSIPQPGNPTPRLFRLPEDKALLNRMGFNNDGARAAAENLAQRRGPEPIGVNLGKSKVTPPEEAPEDYRNSAREVRDVADYLVINVSSPNTPGLRDLQAVDSLRPIIAAVREETSLPLFVKIAPDLSDEDIDAVTDLALELKLTGLVATNTTISREGLNSDARWVEDLGAGGISGAPLAKRSLEVLTRIAKRAEGQLVLIGSGGIDSPQQAWRHITAGASLIQGYTGFIYGGPNWISKIHRGLAAQVRAHGLSNISEAVGSGLEWQEL